MDNELVVICQEIFQNIISQITIHLRFMDIALDQYEWIPNSTSIECDGTYLYYQPIYIIKTFKNNPRTLTRGYLHIVLHSIFRHQFLTENHQKSLWDLACDIAVENMIEELHLDCMQVAKQEELQREIAKIHEHVPLLTAQKIYYYLQDHHNKDQIKWLASLFYFDDHSRWYAIRDVINRKETLFGEESKDDPTQSGQNRFDNASHDSQLDSNEKNQKQEEFSDEPLSEQDLEQLKRSIKKWQEISEKMEVDLTTFSQKYGQQAGTMVQSLARLNQEKYDYTTFLKKFMVFGEKNMINDDEFDYIFYTYGLALYRDMPLIEPLEYKETKNLKDFVIAIDTSGSVSGPIVQNFLQKTYNIFHQQENFFHRMNIHIIQCDAAIQHDAKINTLDDFDRYIENIEIHGLGGTDFRPVFDYVDQLIKQKEITHLAGLIYFTDGDGTYPQKQPDYKVAFVFLENDQMVRAKVPYWGIQYVLDQDELRQEENHEY